MTTGVRAPSRLSYSSLAAYAECGERWKLERGYGIKSGTWWSTLAGTAIHDVTEMFDKGELSMPSVGMDADEFEDGGMYAGASPYELDRDYVAELFAERLDVAEKGAREEGGEIRASGRVLQSIGKTGGPNKKDRDWWLQMGPDYIMRYIEWRFLAGWEVATMPDGRLAIELPLTVDLGNGPQLGYVDRVFITPQGHIVIVDIKTGNAPTSQLQLGVYRVALLKAYGIEADYGTYWMGSDGEITSLSDLTHFTPEYVEGLFEMAWKGIEAGVFLPNVTSMCGSCGVRDYCRAVKGRLAGSLPVEVKMLPPRAGGSSRNVRHVTSS